MENKILNLTGVKKIKYLVAKIEKTIGKTALWFIIINIVIGLASLAGMMLTGDWSAKTFYSCAGLGIASLFNIVLSVIAGLSFKDEETRVVKTVYSITLVNLLVGLAPMASTMVIEEACTKPFYFYIGMFASTSLISLMAIIIGMSFDVAE